MNDDLIRRGDALNVIKRNHHRLQGDGLTYTILIEQMKLVPKKKDILYLCDRKRCDNCHSECELTSDINHAAGAGAVVIFDNTTHGEAGTWLDYNGNPNHSEYSGICSACGTWSEYLTNFCGNCGAQMKGADDDSISL